jgi:hypothetical protein
VVIKLTQADTHPISKRLLTISIVQQGPQFAAIICSLMVRYHRSADVLFRVFFRVCAHSFRQCSHDHGLTFPFIKRHLSLGALNTCYQSPTTKSISDSRGQDNPTIKRAPCLLFDFRARAFQDCKAISKHNSDILKSSRYSMIKGRLPLTVTLSTTLDSESISTIRY